MAQQNSESGIVSQTSCEFTRIVGLQQEGSQHSAMGRCDLQHLAWVSSRRNPPRPRTRNQRHTMQNRRGRGLIPIMGRVGKAVVNCGAMVSRR